jgi:two-component sensor histidine kinase
MQSFPRTEANAPATAAFTARLVALAKAHDVLNQSSWGQTSLTDVIATAVGPFMGQEEPRFAIHGNEITVDPQLSLALSMAFHELCTNAVKYGALSVPGGTVRIDWQRHGTDRVQIIWHEQGGPPVAAPTRQGFGTRLIRHSLGSRNDARIELEFAPGGVRCVFSLQFAGPPST